MTARRITKVLVLTMLLSCTRLQPRDSSELILFSLIQLNGGQIFTVGTDGSNPTQLLASHGTINYINASGNSLTGPFVVLLRQTNSNDEAEELICISPTLAGQCQPLIATNGYKGLGALSPDNLQVAFTLSPKEPYGRHRIWIADLKTGETHQLTHDTAEDKESWDQYPSWRPDGGEIAFLRARRTQNGVVTSLQRISLLGGEPPHPLLSTNEPIAGFCYSPDGRRLAAFTAKGLEIIDLQTELHSILLPWSSIPHHTFRASGMVWSKKNGTIVFALLNTETEDHELWRVPADGKSPKVLYKGRALQMIVSSVLQS